jgi:hypothetical protein
MNQDIGFNNTLNILMGWKFSNKWQLILMAFMMIGAFASGQSHDTIGSKNEKKLKFTAYPAGGYSPETSFSFGAVGFLVFISPDSLINKAYHRPSTISPYFLYTLNKQFLSAIDVESYLNDRINLNTTIRFFNYPDYYYGIGNNSNSTRELFTNKFIKWEGQLSTAILPVLFAGLSYEWMNNTIRDLDPDGDLLKLEVNGYQGGNIMGVGPVIRFDSRNNILYPDQGIYCEIKTLFFTDFFGNDYVFNNLLIDFRAFKKLFSSKNILGFQFHYNQAYGKSIPFYKLPQLGGDIRLRGIEHENRYRDKIAYYAHIEGRRELFWRLGGVLFAGVGKVSPGWSEMSFSDLHYVFGIGGRFRPFKDEKLNVRLDIGKGPGSQYAIYLAIREAF